MGIELMIDKSSETAPTISAIMVADGDGDGLPQLVKRYHAVLDARGEPYEFILLYNDMSPGMQRSVAELAGLDNLSASSPRPWRGEDDALTDGVRRAQGEVVVTLPGWGELDPEEINTLVDAVVEVDMATGSRERQLSGTERPRVALAHGLVRKLFKQGFNDIFCRTRAGRRDVFKEAVDLGVRQHFLPLVAVYEGYRVQEVPVRVAENAVSPSIKQLRAGSHIAALVDLLALYIALNFLKRPLRFFGAIGLPMIAFGALITLWLVFDRLVLGTALGDRPALVFSVMLLILGIQIVALGLIGEIIIFASSRRMRGYEIEKILRGRPSE